jgi:hypothetical protein
MIDRWASWLDEQPDARLYSLLPLLTYTKVLCGPVVAVGPLQIPYEQLSVASIC